MQLDRLAERGVEGLDAVRDWGDELSLGEQQRLAFARVLIRQRPPKPTQARTRTRTQPYLVRRPTLAILDEATSALDLRTEAAMYAALAALPGIAYLSVGHRPSLESFHHSRLRLLGTDPSCDTSHAQTHSPSSSYAIVAIEKLRRMREVKRRRSEVRRRRSDAANASSAP